MHMMKANKFIDKKSKFCAGDAQARYLAWKMKINENMVPVDWLIMAKGKGLNDQIDP